MSAVETLQRVAEMLPPEQRERFLLMCSKFKNVPEDDEYLQMLEAIGFMTLLWKSVPEEIANVLAGSSPIPANQEQLINLLQSAVTESIPSYDDLKLISKRFEDHDLALKRILNQIDSTSKQSGKNTSALGWFIAGASSACMLIILIPTIF